MPQISAQVSKTTKEMLERFSRQHGVKQAWLIETALQHHIRALQELPADVIIPPRFVPTRKAAEKIVRDMKKPPEPPPELVALMRDGD